MTTPLPLESLTPVLLGTAFKSTVLLVLAALVVFTQRKSSAAVRHLTWSAALFGAVLLPLLSTLLPALPIPAAQNWLPAFPTSLATPVVNSSALSITPHPVDNFTPASALSAQIIPAQPTSPSAATSNFNPTTLLHALGLIWLTGVCLSLIYLSLGWAQAWLLTRRCTPLTDPSWQSLLDETSTSLGLRRRVLLFTGEKVNLPLTWGAWYPVLLLPSSAASWPELRRRVVLAHELAHIQRWDWLTLTFANLACAVYWYNPLVWHAAKKMCLEREQACDDLVLHRDTRPSDYANELLQIASSFQSRSLLDCATVPMARRSALEGRLLAILDSHRNRSGLTRRAIILALAWFSIVVLPIAMLRAAAPASNILIASNASSKPTRLGNILKTLSYAVAPDLSTAAGIIPPVMNPHGVAVDKDGMVYIADYDQNIIYKLSPKGELSILAAHASDGEFAWPAELTVDQNNNVYVADSGSDVIRKITPDGTVTNLAGALHQHGSADGKGMDARFWNTTSIAADASGNLFVADNDNFIVRKITSDGTVTTIAGQPGINASVDGNRAAARLMRPRSVAVAPDGALYVVEEAGNDVRKIAPDGTVSTVAGSPTHQAGAQDGAGPQASFFSPRGTVVDSQGNIYIADSVNHTIRKISPPNVVTTFAGKSDVAGYIDGSGADARFNSPRGLAVDKDDNVYVADSNNSAIRKITPAGFVTSVYAPSRAIMPATVYFAPPGATNWNGNFTDNGTNSLNPTTTTTATPSLDNTRSSNVTANTTASSTPVAGAPSGTLSFSSAPAVGNSRMHPLQTGGHPSINPASGVMSNNPITAANLGVHVLPGTNNSVWTGKTLTLSGQNTLTVANNSLNVLELNSTSSTGSNVLNLGEQNTFTTPPAPTMLVTVIGSVNRPGALLIPVGSTLTFVAAIKQSGGPKPAAARFATVTRIVDGTKKSYNVDLSGAMKGTSPDFPLLPNDTIVLGEQIVSGVYEPSSSKSGVITDTQPGASAPNIKSSSSPGGRAP